MSQKFLIVFCFVMIFTESNCDSSVDESYCLIRIQAYGPFSDRIGPKTSLLLIDELEDFQTNTDSILSSRQNSGIRSRIIYYLQSSGAHVLDFNPEHSVIHGCCNFGDGGYVDSNDSLSSVATDAYPIDESKFRNFEICGLPNKVVVGVCRIRAIVKRCKEIRPLAQEVNYSDSISYLCKITDIEIVGNDEFHNLKEKLSVLSAGCY